MRLSARTAAGLLAFTMIAGALPAQAQIFFPGPPPPVYSERPYYPDGDRDRRYDRDRDRYREREREGDRYRRVERPYRQPRAQIGYTCSTSRGACDIGGAPVGTGCRCSIPGFGRKGGSVTP